jgi:bifunctional pyridoxal-dependent enzyme with beta-cystathionase and maltose regulon repressor activities
LTIRLIIISFAVRMESIIDEEYQIMNRVNTPSVKWGLIKFKEDSEAFLMGVADMDLHLSKEIR